MQLARARSCLYGVTAVGMLWALAMFAAAAIAQEPQPQRWNRVTAETLLTYIRQIGGQGLKPVDYEPDQLQAAIASGDAAALEKQATESFGLVADDLATGHIPPGQRGRYYIAPNSLDANRVVRMIDVAIAANQVSRALDSFAPQNPEYAALRAALAGPDGMDQAKRQTLLATLERWRWFPHNPGARYLFVNIPEFRLRLMDGGKEIDNHKVIVGQVGKQTPQFQTQVTGVILNPSWHVPQSIVAESVGSLVRNNPGSARSRGYTWASVAGHL